MKPSAQISTKLKPHPANVCKKNKRLSIAFDMKSKGFGSDGGVI